jgi:hypothetical protein
MAKSKTSDKLIDIEPEPAEVGTVDPVKHVLPVALERVNSIQRNATPDTTPLTLLKMAVEGGADIEKLTKLMELQERWENRQAQKAYVVALSRFQSIVPSIRKRKNVKFDTKDGSGTVDYNYAPLGDIDEQIKIPMFECGLSKDWTFSETKEGRDTSGRDIVLITATCHITHVNGFSKENSFSGYPDASGKKNLIQQKASTIQYLMRYTLLGALGIATADDDIDGRVGKQADEPIDSEQTAKLNKLLGELPGSVADNTHRFLAFLKVESLGDLLGKDYKKALSALDTYKKTASGKTAPKPAPPTKPKAEPPDSSGEAPQATIKQIQNLRESLKKYGFTDTDLDTEMATYFDQPVVSFQALTKKQADFYVSRLSEVLTKRVTQK